MSLASSQLLVRLLALNGDTRKIGDPSMTLCSSELGGTGFAIVGREGPQHPTC
jgi:hypothetical protein